MSQNFDYISMLNMPGPELSPLTATDSEFQNDLDLWLTAEFNIDAMDPAAVGQDLGNRAKSFAYGADAQTRLPQPLPMPQQQEPSAMMYQQPAQMGYAPQPSPLVVPTSFARPGAPSGYPEMHAAALDLFSAAAAAAAVPGSAGGLTLQQMIAATAAINSTPSSIASTAVSAAAAAEISAPAPAPVVPLASDKPASEEREKTLEELDKRRRNTAASARFRLKKKQREQALEQTAKEMTEKAASLERRVKEYEMELKWLRQLVTDRDGKKRLRDFYEESGLTFSEGTMAAGCGIENPSADFTAAAAAFVGALAEHSAPDVKRPRTG